MNLRRTLPLAVLLALAGGAVVLAQDERSPLDSGDIREIALLRPEGTRIEYFRLDLGDTPPAEDAHPVGVVRWISGPDVGAEATGGLRLEAETIFFDVSTRVVHTEHLAPAERKLVYREVRTRAGRTVLLEWSPDRQPLVSEVVGQEVRRLEIDTARGVLLPLYLVEHVRSGVSFQGSFPVFSPLARGIEDLELETLVTDDPEREGAVPGFPRRELVLRRADGLLAGRYVLEGQRLVGFRWQAGGPVARPITEERYCALIRLNAGDPGH